jgi:beta-N-acetylhexosaminidase
MEVLIVTVDALSLEQKIGQMLLVGYPGGAAGEEVLLAELEKRPMGNVILFSRNGTDPDPLRYHLGRMRGAIESGTGIAPLVALDQEGGIVARFRAGLTPMPGAMAIAAAVAGGGTDLHEVEELAAISGTELVSLGFNWNLAPVADVNVNPANPVIGVRSFGERPETVADLVSAYARGLERSGMLATAKHFPGHGDTSIDSHLSLPRVDASLERLAQVELVPFKRLIAERIGSIMTAHVLFPAMEPEAIPATLSYQVLTGLLREGLGYQGVIVTDCLEMKAIHGRYDDAPVRALLAGADMLCISHTAAIQEAAFDDILAAVRSGRIPESRIDESVTRIFAAKTALAAKAAVATTADKCAMLAAPAAMRKAELCSQSSISLVSDSPMPDLSGGGLYVDMLPDALTGAETTQIVAQSVRSALEAEGSTLKAISLPSDPDQSAVDSAVAGIDGTPVVIGVYAMARHPAQAVLVEAVRVACDARGLSLSFVSMREPYDAAALVALGGKARAVLCAYEYTSLSAHAVARVLSGIDEPRGRCPVSIMADH